MGTVFNLVHCILNAARLHLAEVKRTQPGSSNKSVNKSSSSVKSWSSPEPRRADNDIWSEDKFFVYLEKRFNFTYIKKNYINANYIFQLPTYFGRICHIIIKSNIFKMILILTIIYDPKTLMKRKNYRLIKLFTKIFQYQVLFC